MRFKSIRTDERTIAKHSKISRNRKAPVAPAPVTGAVASVTAANPTVPAKVDQLCLVFDAQKVCTSCKIGATYNANKTCVSNCYTFQQNSTVACDSCSPGFQMTKSFSCIAYSPECTSYVKNTNNCQNCTDKTILAKLNGQSFCVPRIEYCLNQTNYLCNQCKTGYVLGANKRQCCLKNFIPKCVEQVENTCKQCVSGYQISNNQCVLSCTLDSQTNQCLCDIGQLFNYPNQCVENRLKVTNPAIPTPTQDRIQSLLYPNCIMYGSDKQCSQCEGEDVFAAAPQANGQSQCVCGFNENAQQCQPSKTQRYFVLQLNKNNQVKQCYPRIQYCLTQAGRACNACCTGFQWNYETGTCCKASQESMRQML